MSDKTIHLISIEKIKVQKHNVRRHAIDEGIEDLSANIRVNGMLQPIMAYFDSEKDVYVILTGQRRLNAHHYLNAKYPEEGFDKIKCTLIDEPDTDQKKMALSLAENITQLPMTEPDRVRAVTDLYNTYNDYEMVQQEFGITKHMIDRYVRLSRLPDELKIAIKNGEISSNPKSAENAALKAVNAYQYTPGGNIPVMDVIELSKVLARSDIDGSSVISEVPKGGTVKEITGRAGTKRKSKLSINLTTEVADKLHKVAENSGETENDRAVGYITKGVAKDYSELDN